MDELEKFLEAKPLFYDEIDYERMPRIYRRIAHAFATPQVIHVVGTNGKGTTGRFLAQALLQNGLKVGHYTSPHMLHFNERIWRNGDNVGQSVLEDAHQKLYKILGKEDAALLSYFEYTTLLAMLVYEQCDYVVLEAGLGGEYDATNVFKKALSLFTPIDLDHQSFLGKTIEAIAATKFRSMEDYAILGRQVHKEVENIFEEVAEAASCKPLKIDELLSAQEQTNIHEIATACGLVAYLQENLLLALSGLKFLGYEADVKALARAPLFGRLTKIRENVLLDVGHNVLAAQSIVKALAGQKYTLVYNSYRDKDYAEIIKRLKPIIKEVLLIAVDDVRVEQEQVLTKIMHSEGLHVDKFVTIEDHKNYLVFGSFSVAEAFLKTL